MKVLSITRKTLLELWREPLLLALMLFFPIVLVGFYYVAFGQTEEGLSTYLNILVINEDAGATVEDDASFDFAQDDSLDFAQGAHWQAGTTLIWTLRATEFEGEPVFDVQIVSDRRAAEIALREHKASLLLAIPPDFTQTLVDQASPAVLSLLGDPGSDDFVFAHSFLGGLVRQFAQEVVGGQDDAWTIAYEFLPGTGTTSDFDFGVGGIIVFGIAFGLITTATVMVRESATGTLRRLQLTRASAGDLLLGVTLAQMAVAAVQVPITFGAAWAMGFRSNGSLLLAMGIGLLFNLSVVGLGLIVACFSRDDGEAANLGSGVLVPVVFLSDALYPMPDLPLFSIAGRTVQVYDVLPTTHAAEAMRRVLISGDGPGAIAYELAATTVLSALLLALGVILYRRLRLRTL
jgi:ABC-2 type transport system permease protein